MFTLLLALSLQTPRQCIDGPWQGLGPFQPAFVGTEQAYNYRERAGGTPPCAIEVETHTKNLATGEIIITRIGRVTSQTPPDMQRRAPCGIALLAEPPDMITPWVARIRRGTTNIGTADSAYPYAPTATLQAGTFVLVIRWTASGKSAVTSAPVTVTCP